MANNLNVILDSASVQVIDVATSTYRVNSPIGNITFVAGRADYQSYAMIANGAGTVFDIGVPPVFVFYVKNLDPTATVRVQVQPTGGALPTAANSPLLLPGGVYIYWQPSGASGGINAVTMVSSASSSAVEVLVGA